MLRFHAEMPHDSLCPKGRDGKPWGDQMAHTYFRELAFALLSANGAQEAAELGLHSVLPAEARAALRTTYALRAAMNSGDTDATGSAALRVLGSALWEAWGATKGLEDSADLRLVQARDELEAAARLALGGAKRYKAAVEGMADVSEVIGTPGRNQKIRDRRSAVVSAEREGLTRRQTAERLGVPYFTVVEDIAALAAAGFGFGLRRTSIRRGCSHV